MALFEVMSSSITSVTSGLAPVSPVLLVTALQDAGGSDPYPSDVTFSLSIYHLQCGCGEYSKERLCYHIVHSLSEGLDAPLTRAWLEDENKNNDVWKVPLIETPVGVLYTDLFITKIERGDGQMFGMVYLPVDRSSPAENVIPGSYSAVGRTYHPVGVLGPDEGRDSLRAQISAWVAMQLAIVPADKIECSGYHNVSDSTSAPVPLLVHQTSILISGECFDCIQTPDPSPDDVPDF